MIGDPRFGERVRTMLEERSADVESTVAPKPERRHRLQMRLRQTGLIAIATMVGASGLLAGFGVPRLLVQDEAGLGQGSPLPPRAYVLLRPTDHATNQLVTIDFVEPGAPLVTPVPLPVSDGARSGPLAIALSRDDSRLFAISLNDEGDVPNPSYRLTVVDPADSLAELGSAVITDYFDEIGGAKFPPLAVSADGSFAYILGHSSIYTYDATANALLPEAALVPDCGPASLMPLAGSRRLAVLCVASQEVHLLEIGPSGEPQGTILVPFPAVPDDRKDPVGNPLHLGNAHWAAITPDLTKIWIVTGNGHVFEVNTQSGAIVEVAGLGLAPLEWVRYSHMSVSADGSTMLVGVQDVSSLRGGDQSESIMVVDTATWTALGRFQVEGRVSWLTLDDSGNIYAAVHDAGTIIVADGGALTGKPTIVSLEGEPVQLVLTR